ncbi:hypothetical protein MPSEU_000590000 [Mayamaea pseudoterrestris]|nr:hypothetical protein MPSEU_000590000 [Mayamaea pseudoterrestris]
MKASNYFATRMANSERVQQRLHEIADTMRLSSQLPADNDGDYDADDDAHSLLSNQAALDAARTSMTSRRRSNSSSVQVVGMTILDRQAEVDDDKQYSLHAETKKTKRRTSSIKRDAATENKLSAASPASSPTNSSKSSVRLQLPVNRPRLLSTTSLRSLSSSQVSSSNASSSQSSNNKSNARHHEQQHNNPLLQRLYRYLCLLPTLLSMLTMLTVTIVSLARTLVWSVWTPWTFVRLVSVWTLGGAVIHYNQLFWHTRRKETVVPESHHIGAVAANSNDAATAPPNVSAATARRPSTKSKPHPRGNLQRMASSTSMRSYSTNKSASSVNDKKKTGSWKFWKRKPKSKSVTVTP